MKRLLAFAVLLVVGFVILQQFLGDEALVTANTNDHKSDEAQGDLGTKITTSGSGIGVSMEKFGEVHWPRVREAAATLLTR